MPAFDRILATIHCNATHSEIEPLVSAFGFRAREGDQQHVFHIVNKSRSHEPEVDEELIGMALEKLRIAERNGSLPRWSVVAAP